MGNAEGESELSQLPAEVQTAALQYLMEYEKAQNFRDPERAKRLQDAGRSTAEVTMRTDTAELPPDLAQLSPDEQRSAFQRLLDQNVRRSHGTLRQAVQQTMPEDEALALLQQEHAEGEGAAPAGSATLRLRVEDRTQEAIGIMARAFNYEVPPRGARLGGGSGNGGQ